MRDDRDVQREPGPQPDPMLREGRMNPGWVWAIAIAIVGAVAALLIAISPPLTNTADVVNPPPGNAPRAVVPSSRDNSNASPTPPVSRPLTDDRGNTTGSGSVAR